MRRAQITIYIILGILILLILGGAIYLAQKAIKKPTIGARDDTVKSYVEDCIRHIGEEGVLLLGKHGGYIEPRNTEISRKHLLIDKQPAEGDLLLPSQLSSTGIVYWTYLSTSNKCKNCVVSNQNVPTLEEIREQLEQYLIKQLPVCLNDFEIFTKKGYKIEQGKMKLDAFFTEEDVRLRLNYPLTVRRKEIITRFDVFETTVEVKLKKMYYAAREINQNLANNALLEDYLSKLIGIYSGTQPWKLPPIGDTIQEKFYTTWIPAFVQFQIQQLLTIYTPILAINNTRNKAVSEQLVLPALSKKQPFYARVHYLGWPFYFDITPETQGALSPDIYKRRFPFDIVPPIQTSTYEFFYDLSVPFIIELSDPTARKKEGYIFQFAAEANIRDNKNMLEWNEGEGTLGPWDPSKMKLGATLQETEQGQCRPQIAGESSLQYQCSYDNKIYADMQGCTGNCTKQKTTFRQIVPTKKFFCDTDQRLSGTVFFKVKDKKKQSVRGAAVSYGCGEYAVCTLGLTSERGILKKKLPVCTGGFIIAEKEGYHKEVLPFATRPGQRHEENITLESYKTLNASVKKYTILHNATGNLSKCCKPATNFGPFEKAVLVLDRKKDSQFDTPVIHTLMFEAGTKPQEITLIPGNYTVIGQFIDNLGFVIPQGCMKVCTKEEHKKRGTADEQSPHGKVAEESGMDPREKECVKWKYLPEQSQIVKPAPLGGVLFNEKSEYLEIKDQHIDTEKSVTFFVLKLPTPNCITSQDCILPNCVGLDTLGRIGDYTMKYKQYVKPQFRT